MFDNLTIKSKLVMVIMVTSCIVLLLCFVGFVAQQRLVLREALVAELKVMAENVSINCAAPLVFDDADSARDVLAAFAAKKQVFYACVYLNDGTLFAEYFSDRSIDLSTPKNGSDKDLGSHFLSRHLELVVPVHFEKEKLGTVCLNASLEEMEQKLYQAAGLGGVGFLIAVAIALLLATRLQKVISGPIESLASAMENVSREKDYSRRVDQHSGDELGRLIQSFNHMLSQVELRDLELQKKQERLQHLANHDPLTKLPNRLLFSDRLQQAIVKARRNKHKMALMFLDLDRFKIINDTLGHDVGDLLICQVADRLKKSIRACDSAARFGGDEFVIILEELQGVHQINDISMVAEKVLKSIEQPFQLGEHKVFVTTSIGVSIFDDDSYTPDGLSKCADMAMYKAKEGGRNNFQFYTAGMNERFRKLQEVENGLHRALDNGHFVLNYQPQMDLRSGRLIGTEALLRWNHPEHGIIESNEFIPQAEESGLIVPIGQWALKEACAQNKYWQTMGFAPIPVAVNISPRQFRHEGLIQSVTTALEESNLDPQYLKLEITGDMIIQDVEKVIEIMDKLNVIGVKLAIDDFGAGYSSLADIKRFPINQLKIGRTFVLKVTTDENVSVILSAIIAMAHSMNLDVVAEGIETEQQLNCLVEKGCGMGQGYFISRPIGPVDMEILFKKNVLRELVPCKP
jgi:diguanylate cyclase (GGDEF)-like protein